MNQPAGITVQWNGDESINTVRDLIEKHHSVTLLLPHEVHHALFFYLEPDNAAAHLPELVSERGNANLLKKVAKIRGFAGIADLIQPALDHEAIIDVVSPSPSIAFEFKH
jgi:hypothetical protein